MAGEMMMSKAYNCLRDTTDSNWKHGKQINALDVEEFVNYNYDETFIIPTSLGWVVLGAKQENTWTVNFVHVPENMITNDSIWFLKSLLTKNCDQFRKSFNKFKEDTHSKKHSGTTETAPNFIWLVNGEPCNDDPCEKLLLSTNAGETLHFLIKFEASFSPGIYENWEFKCESKNSQNNLALSTVTRISQGGDAPYQKQVEDNTPERKLKKRNKRRKNGNSEQNSPKPKFDPIALVEAMKKIAQILEKPEFTAEQVNTIIELGAAKEAKLQKKQAMIRQLRKEANANKHRMKGRTNPESGMGRMLEVK